MSITNNEGPIEIHPGPRGHSVVSVGVTPDGRHARFTTDEPRTLNPIELPRGPQGIQGIPGDPGEARIRVDETAGRRVFLWDAQTATEQMVYGDTGTRLLEDGTTWVRRVGNTVESNTIDATTLPDGFKPASPEAVDAVFLTAQAWPTTLPGTEQAPPTTLSGLEGFQAATANGYPGTAEEWLNMVYRVVLPPAGTTGQFLQRTAEGSGWRDLPRIGAGPWTSITLSNWSPANNSGAFVRMNNDTVELYGLLTYKGATTTVGAFDGTYLRIGVLPPAYAPAHGVDHPITTYRAGDGQPTTARLIINPQGVMSIAAISTGGSGAATFDAKANVAQVNISSTSFALRNSGTA